MRDTLENVLSAGYGYRPASDADRETVQTIWSASQDAEDKTFRPANGWWSLYDWALASSLLLQNEEPVGVVALKETLDKGIAEVRLALLPDARTPETAHALIELALHMAKLHALPTVRLFTPSTATWATDAASRLDFSFLRDFHMMVRPANAPALTAPSVEGITIRPLQDGEDEKALAALNLAWADTWNFRPITTAALSADLEGQRDGFLLALDDATGEIAGTVHAIFRPESRNPDGNPHAWISNLTVTPAGRGRGLGRLLLVVGIQKLQEYGAKSVALGVDGGNPVPVKLYRSTDFEVLSRLEVWQRAV
jgi:mycothiol synthase